jgi:hypothetical protein
MSQSNPAGFERSDVPPPLLLALAIGFLLTVAIVLGAVAAVFPRAVHDQDKGPVAALPPAPRLQTAPRREFVAYEQAERRRLETYGWTDRAQGHVHVPVDQAMREVAAAGWRSEAQ